MSQCGQQVHIGSLAGLWRCRSGPARWQTTATTASGCCSRTCPTTNARSKPTISRQPRTRRSGTIATRNCCARETDTRKRHRGHVLPLAPQGLLPLVFRSGEPDGPLGRIGWRHEFARRVEALLELIACGAAERVVLHRQRPLEPARSHDLDVHRDGTRCPTPPNNRGGAGVLRNAGPHQTSMYLNTPSSSARMRANSPW